MLKIVVTSLVLMRAQMLSGVFSERNALKEWELRSMVFSSLALQIVLIFLGNHRKYVHQPWIKVLTWLAYLLADSVAIYALGMISNMILEIRAFKSVRKMNPHAELSVFWAPFLLLHLGGPDTISAYAREDNEFWLRHSLTLLNQTAWTVYVLAVAETHPSLLFLAILILLSGFYKYGERVYVLRAASNEHFKESLTKFPSRKKFSDKIMDECKLKRIEGYDVVPYQVIEVPDAKLMIENVVADLSSQKLRSWKESEADHNKCSVRALLAAHSLVNTSQRLFADHLFSSDERNTCLSILNSSKWDFKVIEIELGFIFDVFYAKAKAIYTSWGLICRLAITFSISVTLVIFICIDKRRYSRSDLSLTFLLLGGAIFLEFYALFHIIISDRIIYCLIRNKQLAVFDLINQIRPLSKRCRWSNSMGQYSLMSCSTKENDSYRWKFLKLLHADEMVLKFHCQGREDVRHYIREQILDKIRTKERNVQKLPCSWNDRGGPTLSTDDSLNKLKWSIELDFDMSILVWHTATELCYYSSNESINELDEGERRKVNSDSLMSLHLSRYMLYLLFMYPSMLPVGIGSIRFRDTYKEAKKYFALLKSTSERPARSCNERPEQERENNLKIKKACAWLCGPVGIGSIRFQDTFKEAKKYFAFLKSDPETSARIYNERPEEERENDPEIKEACAGLRRQVKTDAEVSVTEDKFEFMLSSGCQLAVELESTIKSESKKWEVISQVWVEMLLYAANKCKAIDHVQQMRHGGELITHVWFLMAHYGLTDHFQIMHSPEMAEIRVNSR